MPSSILVAGIGNVCLGDDGFGNEVARLLAARGMPDGVRVVDFGVRGFDLACALVEPGLCSAVVIDAAERGGTPGSLSVIEPLLPEVTPPPSEPSPLEPHALDPVRVFALARHLGPLPPCLRVVECEPEHLEDDLVEGLSPTVRAAVPEAIALVEQLVASLLHPARG